MKCGACQVTSPEITVAHVRACYAKKNQVEVPGLPGLFVQKTEDTCAPVQPVTADPWAVVRSLQDQLKPFLTYQHGQALFGRFAVRILAMDNVNMVTKFYRIKHVLSGRWKGRTFVEIQASDEYHPVRSPQALAMILKAILDDVDKARDLYASELGSCYQCGRTLTDETSRKLGIGPDCRSKL